MRRITCLSVLAIAKLHLNDAFTMHQRDHLPVHYLSLLLVKDENADEHFENDANESDGTLEEIATAASQVISRSPSSSPSTPNISNINSIDRRSMVLGVPMSSLLLQMILATPEKANAEITSDSNWPLWTALPVAPYAKRKTIMKKIADDVYIFDQLIGIYNWMEGRKSILPMMMDFDHTVFLSRFLLLTRYILCSCSNTDDSMCDQERIVCVCTRCTNKRMFAIITTVD